MFNQFQKIVVFFYQKMLLERLKQKILIRHNLLFLFIWTGISFSSAFGEKAPIKHLTTADGLANNRIVRIYQDRKGFLWFATWEGLSRFDGYDFVNYDTRDGLANHIINDVAEDRKGRLWVANNDNGISRSVDETNNSAGNSASRKFVSFPVGSTYHSNKVNRILIDSKDNLWCLTDDGLYRAAASENPVFALVKPNPKPLQDYGSKALFEDNRGNVWFAIYYELFEVRGGDEVINHGTIFGYEDEFIANIIQDKQGRIIVLSRNNGLFEFVPSSSEWQKLSSDLQKISEFTSLLEDDKDIWFGGAGGLLKLSDGKTTKYSVEQGLIGNYILSSFQDREGNLWIGDLASGINKISGEAIVSYPSDAVTDFDQRLRIIENARQVGEPFANNFLSPSFTVFYKQKKWWFEYSFVASLPLRNSVFRLRNGKAIEAAKFFDNPLVEYDGITFYDGEDGFLWFSKSDGFIRRINSNTLRDDSIEKYPCELLKEAKSDLIIGDRHNGLWIFKRGIYAVRWRNGKCENFPSGSEISELGARSVFLDSRGWLWIGTRFQGVAVTKNPADDAPDLKFYTADDGLLSATVWSIAEDNDGRMYFGTGRGLNRFDPNTGIWQSFTTKDGLTGDLVSGLTKDSSGSIWIITGTGVSKLNPNLERTNNLPPPIYISRINIAGENLPLSETGFAEISATELDSSKNNLTIDFVGLQFKGENALNYQYKLEGIDKDWSKPVKNRTITFANLGSGNYRFLVRAVNQEGLTSASPAAFQFKILPPIYLRWWFLALAFLLTACIIYTFYHLKFQKLLEIERTRTLIATDLHDDIGSNLSKISVLSEVVKMQLEREGKSDGKLLASIADISRQSVSSMSDIVWAINPKRDSALETVRKMREYAEDIFVQRGVIVLFTEPDKVAKIKLPMHLRRDLYLIFKEAVSNVAKHSDCSQVEIIFQIKNSEILLKIKDDGHGFDPDLQTHGNGLLNMQNRVEKLKGKFECESKIGGGTSVEIRVPQN